MIFVNAAPNGSPTKTNPLLSLALLAALVGLSAWLLVGPRAALERVPTTDDCEEAAAIVRKGLRDGDVVRIHPWWFTAPRRELARGLPAFSALDGPLDLRGRPDPLHLLRYRRLWVIAAYGAKAADDAEAVGLPLSELERWSVGNRVRVALYDLPPSAIRYDLLRSLSAAVVRRGRRTCAWQTDRARHHCGEQPWKDVFLARKEVGDATRTCVYAEPHPADTVLTIRYAKVPMDGTLVLHTGFSIEGARRTDGAGTRVRLLLDDRVVADWIEPKNDFVWRRTTVAGDGGVHDVVLEISAPAVGWRQLCYDGAVVGPTAAAMLGL